MAPTSRRSATWAGLWCASNQKSRSATDRALAKAAPSLQGAVCGYQSGIFARKDIFPSLFALYEALQAAYNESMANGWESNSAEAQQIDQPEQIRAQEIVDEKERVGRLKAEEARKVQALQLTRARIREQLARTSNERYTLLLNTELQQIESDLAKLV
jgi:hypothetical protein